MIVRVFGEGQYDVSEDLLAELEELDGLAVTAIQHEDEVELDRCLEKMAELVRTRGSRLPEDALTVSEIVIPPTDLTLEETRRLFSEDEGLIPDPGPAG